MDDRRFSGNAERGISLVELVVVGVILGIMLTVTLPGLKEARGAAAGGTGSASSGQAVTDPRPGRSTWSTRCTR